MKQGHLTILDPADNGRIVTTGYFYSDKQLRKILFKMNNTRYIVSVKFKDDMPIPLQAIENKLQNAESEYE